MAKTADANDYSRFDGISDSDDEEEKTSLSAATRVQHIGTAKQAGNAHVAMKEFKAAASQYRKGLKVVEDLSKAKPPPNPVELAEAKELELSLQLNLSMVNHGPSQACAHATESPKRAHVAFFLPHKLYPN